MPTCLTKNFHGWVLSISGIFGGQAICADNVSPRMNNIVSRDQLKQITIGEILW